MGRKGIWLIEAGFHGKGVRRLSSLEKTDPKMLCRVNVLIKEIPQNPFAGIGKPEPLKYALLRYWSRRVTEEHRIVYKVMDDAVLIAQIRYHY